MPQVPPRYSHTTPSHHLYAYTTYAMPRFTRATSPVTLLNFEDETREIKARTNEIMSRVRSPVPRSYHTDMLIPRSLERDLDPVSHRTYIETQVYSPMRQIHQDISTKSRYAEPAKAYIGRGHLACLSFAGGRPINRRKGLTPRYDEDRDIRDNVKFLSFYSRARGLASGLPDPSLELAKGGSKQPSSQPDQTEKPTTATPASE